MSGERFHPDAAGQTDGASQGEHRIEQPAWSPRCSSQTGAEEEHDEGAKRHGDIGLAISDQVLQPFQVVKILRQKGVHAAQNATTDHHAQHQVITEPGIALALHGEHIAAVELRQHPNHHAKPDQIAQIDRQEVHQWCVFPFQLESLCGIEAPSTGIEACQTQNVCPGIGPEGGDNHQQQHHRSGGVQQFLDGVDEASDRGTEHCCDTGAAAGGHDQAAEGHGCFQPARHLPCHGAAHLNRRSFRAEREAAANGHDPSHQLHQAHLKPHRHRPVFQESHDVGDA